MECSICPIIIQNIKKYVSYTKYFFSPKFISENYYKHFGYSLVLTFLSIWFLFSFAHLGDTGKLFPIFVGGFGAYLVNWFREWYYSKYHEAPWDDVDVNMGSYGGIVGSILFILFF